MFRISVSLHRVILTCCGMLVVFLCLGVSQLNAQPVEKTDAVQLRNADFEEGLKHWNFQTSHEAKAVADIDKEVFHAGKISIRMSNQSPKAPNVFGGLYQNLKQLKPMTQYRLTFWCKADAVKNAWVGGGPKWQLRQGIPNGTYDWKQLELKFQTGIDETQFHLRFNIDDLTTAIWIDDVSLEAIGPGRLSLSAPATTEGIPAEVAFYPAFEGVSVKAPLLELRDEQDAALGADVRIHWDAMALYLTLHVLDPTQDPIYADQNMWMSDSVQLGIEMQLDQAQPTQGATNVELGLTVDARNALQCYAWHPSSDHFDVAQITGQGKQFEKGYDLSVAIPWALLLRDAQKRPDVLGINIVINDGNQGQRRFVAWTPGITNSKNPTQFAQLHLLSSEAKQVMAVTLDAGANQSVDVKKTLIAGKAVCYSITANGQRQVSLATSSAELPKPVALSLIPFPAMQAGQCSVVRFALPADQMPTLGRSELLLREKSGMQLGHSMPMMVMDYENSQKNKLQSLTQRLDELTRSCDAHGKLALDAQLRMGLYIAQRFIKRVSDNRKQTLAWSHLQLQETEYVLDQTQARLAVLQSQPDSAFAMTIPTGALTVRDGLLWDNDKGVDRPVFLNGYGHFGQVVRDLPDMNTLGATLIQQERGPKAADADGHLLPSAEQFMDVIDKAQAAGVKMEMLLSPHYFPQWAVDLDPDVLLEPKPHAFIKYNIDHPVARRAISQWLDAIVPLVSEHPNLFSLCLANEPVYESSGKDIYSRPAFTAFLQQRYQQIDKLNQHYGQHYGSFDQVPVPVAVGDDGKTPERLAYYDWVRFNQRHFADWLGWMNRRVKNLTSRPFTHIKQMADIYNRATFSRGTDPEMISALTDLAGNDCWANPSPGSSWCYGWQREQIWYDLLHSFDGKPVFNSENHFILDDSPPTTIPADITRAVHWQGMLHHVAASTDWVWEEANGVTDLMGSIYYRPGNIYGASTAMIQGNAFANELAAFNQQSAQVALLYSYPSIYWQPDHPNNVTELYTALTLHGQPVTFISENQLATGKRSIANRDVKVLLLPHATHITEAAIQGLQQFMAQGGKVIAVGSDNAAYDDFAQPRKTLPSMLSFSLESATQRTAEKLDALLTQHGITAIALIDTQTRKAAWGVEYRVLRQADRLLVTMTNVSNEPLTVALDLPNGQVVAGTDMLSQQPVDSDHIKLTVAQSCLLSLPMKRP